MCHPNVEEALKVVITNFMTKKKSFTSQDVTEVVRMSSAVQGIIVPVEEIANQINRLWTSGFLPDGYIQQRVRHPEGDPVKTHALFRYSRYAKKLST